MLQVNESTDFRSCRGIGGRRRVTAALLLLVLVAAFGCAGSGTGGNFARMSTHDLFPDAREEAVLPLSEEAIRLRSGKVAVTSGRFDPTFDIVDGPAKGALRGAGRGLVSGFLVTLASFGIFAPEILLGPIRGAMTAEPAVTVEKRETAIRELVTAQKIRDDVRDGVVTVGRVKTTYILTVLTDQGPSAPDERPDYRSLRQEGIQTVLEVVVESVALEGGGNFDHANPSLALRMVVNVRWVRTNDNVELYRNKFSYYSKSKRTLAEWLSDPEGLRNELSHASAEIAQKIVKEGLFRASE